jgi:hypothetical protein
MAEQRAFAAAGVDGCAERGESWGAENARRVNSSKEAYGTSERIHAQISHGPEAHEVSVVLVVIVSVRRRAMEDEDCGAFSEGGGGECRAMGEKP